MIHESFLGSENSNTTGGLKIGVRKDLMPNSRWRLFLKLCPTIILSQALVKFCPCLSLVSPDFFSSALWSQQELRQQHLLQCLCLKLKKLRSLVAEEHPTSRAIFCPILWPIFWLHWVLRFFKITWICRWMVKINSQMGQYCTRHYTNKQVMSMFCLKNWREDATCSK